MKILLQYYFVRNVISKKFFSMEETIYQVKTNNFEGPFDLLLNLIEKRKLHISDVSLAEVTDDYISYIQNNAEETLPDITLFLSIAATLVLLKSKMLLDGGLNEEDESTHTIHNLEERLKLLELIRSSTANYTANRPSPYLYFQKRKAIKQAIFIASDMVTKSNLYEIANTLINNLPKIKKDLPKVTIMRVMTLEEMIGKITNVVKSFSGKTSFSKIAGMAEFGDMTPKEKKVSVIVSFLAVLELVHSGILDVSQNNTYGDIECEKINYSENNVI